MNGCGREMKEWRRPGLERRTGVGGRSAVADLETTWRGVIPFLYLLNSSIFTAAVRHTFVELKTLSRFQNAGKRRQCGAVLLLLQALCHALWLSCRGANSENCGSVATTRPSPRNGPNLASPKGRHLRQLARVVSCRVLVELRCLSSKQVL
jgi:hypothetical protein